MTERIETLAKAMAGTDEVTARKVLQKTDLSLAETSEILAASRRAITGTIDPDWQGIVETIKGTLRVSIRLGDRFDLSI